MVEDITMKNTYLSIFATLLTGGLVFMACSSEDEIFNEPLEPAKAMHFSIPASFADADTRAIELVGGNSLNAYFEEGEEIKVHKVTNLEFLYQTKDANNLITSSSGRSTTLVGDLAGSYEVGDHLWLGYGDFYDWNTPFFNYGGQDGTFETVKKFDYAYAWVEVTSVNSSEVITTKANFVNAQSFFRLHFKEGSNTLQVKQVHIYISDTGPLAYTFNPLSYGQHYNRTSLSIIAEEPLTEVWIAIPIDESATDPDTVRFIVEDAEGKIYEGNKDITAGQQENGAFYDADISVTDTGDQNTLQITPADSYTLSGSMYNITGNATITGKSINYNINMAQGSSLTLNNVEIVNGSITPYSSDGVNNVITLVGDNRVTNGNLGIHPYHGSVTLKGTGSLIIDMSSYGSGLGLNPSTYRNVYTEDGLVWFYDSEHSTATFKVPTTETIDFEDSAVKTLCLTWDTNHDGNLSYTEAAAVTSLGNVFKNNLSITSFKELRFFLGLTSITDNAFDGCSNLEEVTLPNSVTSIGNFAFRNTKLELLVFPPNVTSIGQSAFESCTNLKGSGSISIFSIPRLVTTIGNSAFKGCSALAGLEVSSTNITIGVSAFEECYLRSNSASFYYATSVSLGDRAFFGTQLWYVDLRHATTLSFGKEVFMNSQNFNSLYLGATTPPAFGKDMLKGSNFDATDTTGSIRVPSASINTYKEASGWNDYADRIVGF